MEKSSSYSFGETLRVFRKHRRLTQQKLAAKLNVHRNTIGGWERGDFLPDMKGTVLELAKLLHLDEQETRHLLEASLTALVPPWNVPAQRNPFFTGREEILGVLHQGLFPNQVIALTQSYALHGLGGIGKTQLAVEYAYRHALEYAAVFWIRAESVESIVTSFLAVAELLGLPECREADQQRSVVAVQRWLSIHKEWLLIWDNLEDLDLLSRFLPPARQGAFLITTRRQSLGTLARGLELAPLEQEEGILFLLRRMKALDPEGTSERMHQLAQHLPTEYAAARELVAIMGGVPLALDQAGAYIEETGGSLSDYLQRYEQQHAQLLDRRGGSAGEHPHSVMATFVLASQRLEREHPVAAALLRLCACLHAEAIPEEIFEAGSQHLEWEFLPVVTDPYQLDLAIAALRTLSLVQRHAETRTLSIHRLVQAVLREQMSEHERGQWQQRAIRMLNVQFPEVAHESWRQCERLLPHVLACATSIPDHANDQELADVLRKAADYLRERGQYEQAEALYQRALRIWEQAVGFEHPQVAHTLKGLAMLYYEQGKYEQGEALCWRTLRIWEQAVGFEHLQVAHTLQGLAIFSFAQGKYEQAEALHQRALRIREQVLGSEHPQVAAPLNNLANLYLEQGKYEQAEPLFQRALRIWEQALGDAHPQTAYTLNGLAILYAEQGKYEQAEPLFQRALRIREQALGDAHPDAAFPLSGLANLYTEQGKYEQAEPLFQRALRIREQVLGDAHPDTARSLADVAMFYERQGKYEQAESLLQRACAIFEQRLGRAHPKTVKAQNDYRRLLQQRGRASEARIDEQPAPRKPLSASPLQNVSPSSVPPEEVPAASERETDPLKDFLTVCCELHPRAWSRASELWQAYERWAAEYQERFPLSRRAFTAYLKAHGCRADRTKASRIWRGIAVVKKDR